MQKPLEIPISVGELHGLLVGIGSYDEDHPLNDMLFPQQHNHTYYELHYVLKGSCVLKTDRGSYSIDRGHLFLIPPEMYHHFKSADKELRKIDVAFELEHPAEKTARSVLQSFPAGTCLDISIDAPECELLRRSILAIGDVLQEGRENTFLGREQLRAVGNLMLVELYALLSGRSDGIAQQFSVDSRVHLIESFIANHYNDKDTCDDLARLLHVSQRQLTRIVHQLYNMNFREKVNEMRLQNALDLLATTDLTVAEISERLGYSSPSNFSIFIKKQTGKTPTQLRSQK